MTSIRGRLVQWVIGRAFNMNSSRSTDSVARMREKTAFLTRDCMPSGFTLTKELTAQGTRYERLRKTGAPKTGRVLLYFHGGAYVVGLLPLYRKLATPFYEAAGGCEVILLDYRCAPEYTYPVQLEEAMDLWEELTKRQGCLPENIILGGDSAGGNLTLALMLRLRDLGRDLPRAAFCISPWADMTGSQESFRNNYGRDVMFGKRGGELTDQFRAAMLNSRLYGFVGEADRYSPCVSPVFGDYHGFPPMFFTAGGNEMLLDDTRRILEKLRESGVWADCDIQPGMFHIYVLFSRLVPEGRVSLRRIQAFIREQYRADQ